MLCVQVQRPTAAQYRETKMGPGKVFVVYHETLEYEALPEDRVSRWSAQRIPKKGTARLLRAVTAAQLAVAHGAVT